MRIVEGCGWFLGVGVLHSTSLLKRQEQEKFWRTLLRKNKKESKVSGNKNLFCKRFWSKSKEVQTQILIPSRVTLIGISENSWYGSKSVEKNHLMFKTTTEGGREFFREDDVGCFGRMRMPDVICR